MNEVSASKVCTLDLIWAVTRDCLLLCLFWELLSFGLLALLFRFRSPFSSCSMRIAIRLLLSDEHLSRGAAEVYGLDPISGPHGKN